MRPRKRNAEGAARAFASFGGRHRYSLRFANAALVALLFLSAAFAAVSAHAASARSLKLATWNLEWLLTPEEFDRLASDCVVDLPRTEGRVIPCNIVSGAQRSLRRSPEDLAALRKYSARLDADVIALQEVDGKDAAKLVFPGYRFCFTQRVHVQNVGFAVRDGIPFRCELDLRALGLDSAVRLGASLTLFPDSAHPIELLSVHLKSGCNHQVLSNRRDECKMLARQVPVLKRWIDARVSDRTAFAVLGDFNRRFNEERPQARDARGRVVSIWPEISRNDLGNEQLMNVTQGEPYVPCRRFERFHAYIDHILLSNVLAPLLAPGSFRRVTFDDEDRDLALSDHCPVSVTLQVPGE